MDTVTWLQWLSENPLAVAVFVLSVVLGAIGRAFWSHVMIPVKTAIITHLISLDKNMDSHTKALDSLAESNEKVSQTLTSLCQSSQIQAQYITELRAAMAKR